MKRRTAMVGGGAVAVIATVVSLGGHAMANGSTAGEGTTIHVIDTDAKVAFHDLNQNGRPDFGDLVIFRSIDTTPDGQVAGHGIGQVAFQGTHHHLLTVSLVLHKGQIAMQGDIVGLETGAQSKLAVIGGTGAYAGARGYTESSQIGDGTTDLVIHLED